MSRVVCRRGVSRGRLSRAFTADHVIDALQPTGTDHVYMELDSAGLLTDAAGRGAAMLAASARLAPHVAARRADVTLCGAGDVTLCGDVTLRLRTAADLPPHAELLLWFAEDASAALDMPFLALHNIRGRRDYVCHECGAGFDEPNPLKVHLFLSCAAYEPAAFWREVAARLRAVRPPPAPALTPTLAPTPAPAPAPTPAPAPAPAALPPAALEALATEWGRSRDGHVCVYCGKLYSRRYGLKIHIRTHTGYRPLRCRYCLRAFGDPSNLNKHVRLHSSPRHSVAPPCSPRDNSVAPPCSPRDNSVAPPCSPRYNSVSPPYSCAVCGRALARRRDLERHERTHAHTHTHRHPPRPPLSLSNETHA